MPVLKVVGFDGAVPRTSATMLGDSQAQTANNVKLYSKELRYWRGPTAVYTPAIAGVQTIYRLYQGVSTSAWMTWNTVVDAAPGPLADTSESRLYFTGSGSPKKTNYTLATTGSAPYPVTSYEMGVPAPTSPPSVTGNLPTTASTWNLALTSNVAINETFDFTKTGGVHVTQGPTTNVVSEDFVSVGAATVDSRVYVYTYLSTFGTVIEESAPSPASVIVGAAFGETITVGSFAPAPTTGYNITGIRIYRSVTGASTSNYFFVAELPISATSYADNLTTLQLGNVLGTIGWNTPPAALSGLVPLACGSLAGFVGNTVYFSEPFYAHAWPLKYAISLPFTIIGLGVFGNSVVVATDRYPYVISGVAPGSMSAEQVPIPEPCVAKSSIASDEHGVVYASPNGLVTIGETARGVTTNKLFHRDEWQAQNPAYMRGVIYDNKYIGAFLTPYQANNAVVLSREDESPAISVTSAYAVIAYDLTYLTMNMSAAFADNKVAALYIVNATDNNIYQVDADDLNPYTYKWRSKRFVLPVGTKWSALKVDADFGPITGSAAYNAAVAVIAAQNATLFASPIKDALNNYVVDDGWEVNGSTMLNQPLAASSRSVQVNIYADQILQAAMTASSFDPIRLPAFNGREIEIELIGNLNVRSVALATTVTDFHSS